MVPYRIALVAIVAMAGAITGVAESGRQCFSVTKDGKPACSIIIAENARKAARFAAAEIQAHVKLISGAELPIVSDAAAPTGPKILVGESSFTKAMGLDNATFGAQEYLVRVTPEAVVLIGSDEDDFGPFRYAIMGAQGWPSAWDRQGTMYAAYDFLEQGCGVKWLAPYEGGTVLPKAASLGVKPFESRRKPFFEFRNVMGDQAAERYFQQGVDLWCGRDDSASAKAFDQLAHENLHKEIPWANAYRMTGLRYSTRLFLYRHKEGGRKVYCNHSFNGYYNRFWENNSAFPGVFEERRAEWFAQGYKGRPPQFCYSNRGFIEQVAKDACEYFEGKPRDNNGVPFTGDLNQLWGQDFYAVEPNDNNSFCKCAECQKLIQKGAAGSSSKPGLYSTAVHGDYFFAFVNEVAKLVRQKHPDKTIVALSYMSHAFPPSFKLESNVAIQFCFAANRLPYATDQYENELSALNAWGRQSGKRPLYLWLYYTFPLAMAMDGKFDCFPGAFAHTLGQQFDLFKENGYRGFFHCGYGQDVEAYVTYKLMDNPDLRVDDLLAEYFQGLYGKAADPMRAFYELVEKTYCDPQNYPPNVNHQTMQIAWGWLGTAQRMAELSDLVSAARAAADSESAKRNVALFELSTWNYMCEGKAQYQTQLKANVYKRLSFKRIPFVGGASLAGGPSQEDWAEALALTDWRTPMGEPTHHDPQARLLTDGQRLFIRLSEPQVAKRPQADGPWEVLIAATREGPVRRVTVGLNGRVVDVEQGWGAGVVAKLDKSERRGVCLSMPLETLFPGGAKDGMVFYLNVGRQDKAGGDPLVYVPTFGEVDAPDRMAAFTLDEPQTIPADIPEAKEWATRRDAALVGRWRMTEGRGLVVPDASGHGLDGTLTNGASLGKVSGRPAVRLNDKLSQYVELGDAPVFSPGGPFSLTVWVRHDPTELDYPGIVGKGYGGDEDKELGGGYGLQLRPGSTVWFELDAANGKRYYYNPTERPITPHEWTHVAAVHDGKTMRVYVNGREAGTGLAADVVPRKSAQPLRIGWLGSYAFFNGAIGEVALYARALSGAEVYAAYRWSMEPGCPHPGVGVESNP